MLQEFYIYITFVIILDYNIDIQKREIKNLVFSSIKKEQRLRPSLFE